MSPRPLIHIGYPKTGSTYLQHTLFSAESPCFVPLQVDGSAKSLAHLFLQDRDGSMLSPFDLHTGPIREAFEQAVSGLSSDSRIPVISHRRLTGSPFGGGFDSRTLADRIAAAFPDALILCLVREQTSMIVSTYSQYLKMGGVRHLEEMLSQEWDRQLPGMSFCSFEYDRLVAHYLSIFPRANVLVLPFEMMRSAPAEFFRLVSIHAGAPSFDLSSIKVEEYNTSSFASLSKRFPFLNAFRRTSSLNSFSALHNRFSRECIRLLDSVVRLDESAHNQELKARVMKLSGDRFVESNRRLGEFGFFNPAEFGYRC